MLHVDAATFRSLVNALIEHGQLQWDHMDLLLEESLAIFLFICGHSERHRSAADRFQHSNDTICKHFTYMRHALCNLGHFVIQPPNFLVTPPKIVVDVGYKNIPGYLAPYRSVRYHLSEFTGDNVVYEGAMDIFNRWHGKLRNVIERGLGVLKSRFVLLNGMTRYKPYRQPSIVTACCVVHNWIIIQRHRDEFFEGYEEEDPQQNDDEDEEDNVDEHHHIDMSRVSLQEMEDRRNDLVEAMWTAHVNDY